MKRANGAAKLKVRKRYRIRRSRSPEASVPVLKRAVAGKQVQVSLGCVLFVTVICARAQSQGPVAATRDCACSVCERTPPTGIKPFCTMPLVCRLLCCCVLIVICWLCTQTAWDSLPEEYRRRWREHLFNSLCQDCWPVFLDLQAQRSSARPSPPLTCDVSVARLSEDSVRQAKTRADWCAFAKKFLPIRSDVPEAKKAALLAPFAACLGKSVEQISEDDIQ